MGTVGQRLRIARKEVGVSQEWLAEKISCGSKSSISDWEKDKRLIPTYYLQRICRELGVSADYVLGLRQAEEQEHEGIRWVASVPDGLTANQAQSIEEGIKVFGLLVKENRAGGEIKDILGQRYIRRTRTALRAAIRAGAVQITCVPRDELMEEVLVDTFDEIQTAIVADIPHQYDSTIIMAELVAFLATRYALESVGEPKIVGMGAGYTLLRFAEQSLPSKQFTQTKWVPLMTFASPDTGSKSPNHIANVMAYQHPDSTAWPIPEVFTGVSRQVYHDAITSVERNLLENPDVAFVTVGAQYTDRESMTPKLLLTADGERAARGFQEIYETSLGMDEIVGEFLGFMVHASGEITPLNRKESGNNVQWVTDLDIFQIRPDVLRSIVRQGTVWLIAAGDYKAKAVYAVIKCGLVNSLVVDSTIAHSLIEQERHQQVKT